MGFFTIVGSQVDYPNLKFTYRLVAHRPLFDDPLRPILILEWIQYG